MLHHLEDTERRCFPEGLTRLDRHGRTHVVGSVHVTRVVLVKERHQVEEQVEGAVDALVCCDSLTAIPAGTE